MAQETFKNLLCSAIFGDETRLHSVGTAVPQIVAVLKITSEFRFDSIAVRELLAASLRIKATLTPPLSAFTAEQRLRIAMRNLRRVLWRHLRQPGAVAGHDFA